MRIKKVIFSLLVLSLILCFGASQKLMAKNQVNSGTLVITQTQDQTSAPADEISKKYGFNLPEELVIGRSVAYGLIEKFDNKVDNNENLNRYVNLVGQSIAKAVSKRPDIKYKFGVIDSDEINAFACPGGYIFVTTGLLKVIFNENELAAILAHEIGHVEYGHGLKDIRTHKADEYAKVDVDNLEKDLGAINDIATSLPYAGWYASYYSPANIAKRQVGNLIGNFGGGYGGYVASSVASSATDVAIDAASQGLKKLAKAIAKKAIARWYYDPLSPEIELEADKFSAESLAVVGYDPNGLTSFLETLQYVESKQQTTASGVGNVFTYRHPSTADRISSITSVTNQPGFKAKNPNASNEPIFKSRYKENIAILEKG